MPSNDDFKLLETLVDVLKPLGILTDALSGEKQVTSSAIIPILKHLKENILKEKGDDDTVAKSMKQRMLNDITQRYELQNDLLDVATLLDPRFKDHYLENKENTYSLLKEEAISILSTSSPDQESPANDTEAQDQDIRPPPQKKKSKGLAAVLKHIVSEDADRMPVLSPWQVVQNEISRYTSLPNINPEGNPLEWWKNEQHNLPTLARLAKKYLAICATSVPSEHIFSKAGFIADQFRSRLKPENLDRLVFLANNLD